MAGIRNVKTELESTGFANMPYDNVVFEIEPSFASRHLMSIGSWDEAKRNSARKVLQAARENFHRHPRPWWVHLQAERERKRFFKIHYAKDNCATFPS